VVPGVLTVGQPPPFGSNPLRCVVTALRWGLHSELCALEAPATEARLAYAKQMLRDIARDTPDTSVVFLDELICGPKKCRPWLNDTYLYRDDDHLNPSGARILFQSLLGTKLASLAGLAEPRYRVVH
jgi:SGNH domain (fused to AT3 domains)